MRIAYVINRYPAVSHSFIRREIAALEAVGIEVFRFSIRPTDTLQLPDQRDRDELSKTVCLLKGNRFSLVTSALLSMFRHPFRSLRALRIAYVHCDWRPTDIVRRAAYFAEASFIASRLRLERIDHMHAHFGTNPATVVRIASILTGVPYSFTVHGPDEFDAPGPLDLAGKVRDAAFCVAISSFGKSQIMRWSAFRDWPKINVVRCGVDENFIEQPDICEPTATPTLCAVARLSAQKGIPLLLDAAAEMKRRGRHFHLILVGDGEMRPEVEEIISSHQLTDIVKLAGWADTSAVIEHLRSARAMVLPSFAEGLPVVIMEALALNRPVIVTAIAGTPELVDADCGWLVTAGSVSDLVSAMEQALDANPEQLTKMGRTGRDRVLRLHNSRSNGEHLATIFRSGGASGT